LGDKSFNPPSPQTLEGDTTNPKEAADDVQKEIEKEKNQKRKEWKKGELIHIQLEKPKGEISPALKEKLDRRSVKRARKEVDGKVEDEKKPEKSKKGKGNEKKKKKENLLKTPF